MRDAYKEAARTVDRRLAAVLEASGLTGTEWTWEEDGISDLDKRKLLFVPASVPSGKQQGDFLAWLEAFTCTDSVTSEARPPLNALLAVVCCALAVRPGARSKTAVPSLCAMPATVAMRVLPSK